jgi:hypothetical protein
MSRWAEAYRRTLRDTVDTIDSMPPAGCASSHSVNSVNSVTVCDIPVTDDCPLPDRECDGASIRAEPSQPPIGTLERNRLDAEHAAMVAGLRAVAQMRPAVRTAPAAIPAAREGPTAQATAADCRDDGKAL